MAQRNKSSEYWAKRFELLEQSQHEICVQCFSDIERQYRLAQKEIEKEIAKWYTRFAENNSITMQQARKLLTDKQLEEFKWDVHEYIRYGEENSISGTWAKQLENASARYHISRLEALKIHTQHHLEVLFGNQLDYIDAAMRDTYVRSYNHTAYEIQKGVGVGWNFAKLDEIKISKVINKPWAIDGKNFSERIWGNGQRLVNQLHSELTRNIVLGKDPQKSISAIAKRMETSKAAAGKLIMTESAFFNTTGQKDCFTELDVEEFEVIETLDSHTCSECDDMDGKHFPMTEWIVGVTVPPFHPWCRGTTAPYFEDDFDVVVERIARGADGKTYYVPADMTYEQWKRKQDDLYGTGTIDKKRIMAYNESADKSQFERYKERLGTDAPKSFADFQKIKYDTGQDYSSLKLKYADAGIQNRIKSGKIPITVLEGKQGKHILGHNNYIPGRSYLNNNINVTNLVKQYAGTGTIKRDANGKWTHKEEVTASYPIGYAVSMIDGSVTETSTFTIHYSKQGVHIVPKKE